MATRIRPPKPGTPVPKEYVRQQLNTLGIRNVTEDEIESYAAGKTTHISMDNSTACMYSDLY